MLCAVPPRGFVESLFRLGFLGLALKHNRISLHRRNRFEVFLRFALHDSSDLVEDRLRLSALRPRLIESFLEVLELSRGAALCEALRIDDPLALPVLLQVLLGL